MTHQNSFVCLHLHSKTEATIALLFPSTVLGFVKFSFELLTFPCFLILVACKHPPQGMCPCGKICLSTAFIAASPSTRTSNPPSSEQPSRISPSSNVPSLSRCPPPVASSLHPRLHCPRHQATTPPGQTPHQHPHRPPLPTTCLCTWLPCPRCLCSPCMTAFRLVLRQTSLHPGSHSGLRKVEWIEVIPVGQLAYAQQHVVGSDWFAILMHTCAFRKSYPAASVYKLLLASAFVTTYSRLHSRLTTEIYGVCALSRSHSSAVCLSLSPLSPLCRSSSSASPSHVLMSTFQETGSRTAPSPSPSLSAASLTLSPPSAHNSSRSQGTCAT